MKVDKITVKLSLREARAVARAVSFVRQAVYDFQAKELDDQPEIWRILSNVEYAIGSGLADISDADGFGYRPGFAVRTKWLNESVLLPFKKAV